MKDIPLDFDPRPQQIEILDFVKSSIDSGKKFIMIDAPTGVGKSYAAIMVAEWYRKNNKPLDIEKMSNTVAKLINKSFNTDISEILLLDSIF